MLVFPEKATSNIVDWSLYLNPGNQKGDWSLTNIWVPFPALYLPNLHDEN